MTKLFQPMLFATCWFVSVSAVAQSAGGFSAGPGEASATYRALPEGDGGVLLADGGADPASRDDTGADYDTRVVTYRKSPSFTQDREFTTTRMWVLDPGKITVEQWWNGFWGARSVQTNPLDPHYHPNNNDDQFMQTEVEWGIAPHFQLDVYGNYEFNQNDSGNYQVAVGGHTGVAAELRYALGNYWGQIWANPTLYAEITSQYYNSPRAEFRLLLGGEVFTPKLLGALNLAIERNIFRDNVSGIDYEIKADYGLNYEIVKNIFRFGVEGVLGFDSYGDVNAQGYTQIHPVAWVGPSLLLTEPKKRIKLLAAFFKGFSDWDQPWISTIIVSSSF